VAKYWYEAETLIGVTVDCRLPAIRIAVSLSRVVRHQTKYVSFSLSSLRVLRLNPLVSASPTDALIERTLCF
jgi:hypothetical protein